MTTNKPGIEIYEPSEKGVTAMRKASFRNTGLNRYVRLSDYEALQSEREKLVEALKGVMYCNEVGFLPESVQQAVSNAIDTATQGDKP